MAADFSLACPGETLTPIYSCTGLDSNFAQNTGSMTFDWSSGSFTSDVVYTATLVGKLAAPHTMTITKVVTLNIKTLCSTATLSNTEKSPLTVQYYNVGDPAATNPTYT